MFIIKEEIVVVTRKIEGDSAQMSEGYWKYIELAYELMNPPADLCRTEAMELDIKRFYRNRVSAMEQLLRSLVASEKLLAESYFNVTNFPLDRFIRICCERCESALPGDSINQGFEMLDMAEDGG